MRANLNYWNQPVIRANSNCLGHALNNALLGSVWLRDIEGIDEPDLNETLSPKDRARALDEHQFAQFLKHPNIRQIRAHDTNREKSHIMAFNERKSHVYKYNAATGVWSDKAGDMNARYWDSKGQILFDLEETTDIKGDITYVEITPGGLILTPNFKFERKDNGESQHYEIARHQFYESGHPLNL